MSGGERWAIGFVSGAGALLWFVGVIAHVPLLLFVFDQLHLAVRGVGLSVEAPTGAQLLSMMVAVVSGPLLVAVGGGMRFFAAALEGSKVAGRFAGRILGFEWLRYECLALATGIALALFVLAVSVTSFFLIALPVGLLAGLACQRLAGGCQLRSEGLMWEVRLENLPPEADAHPMKVLRMTER